MAFPDSTTSRLRCVTWRSAARGTGGCSTPTRCSTSAPPPDSGTWCGCSTAAPYSESTSTSFRPPTSASANSGWAWTVGFGCATRAELESWMARLNELGVQHGGIVDAPYGSGLSFRDPDGIALDCSRHRAD